MLARQLRLRLIAADDSDVPRSLNNIIVSIHAIATFQALHDYLRPRVAGLLGSGSRISGMLAALAASGLAASSSGQTEPPKPPSTSEAAQSPTVSRRRSLRLSAKRSGQQSDESPAASELPSSHSEGKEGDATEPGPIVESAPSDTIVNEDFGEDFTDDEVDVDAEVCAG